VLSRAVRIWEAGVAAFESLMMPGNLVRETCRGKHVLEIGAGVGLLGKALDGQASATLTGTSFD
jgi:predicted nicotinamide N-methyase